MTTETEAPKREPVPREERFCEKEGKVTEWRRYKIERTWSDEDQDWTGPYRYQWRCYSCLRRTDNKNKARMRRKQKAERSESAAS